MYKIKVILFGVFLFANNLGFSQKGNILLNFSAKDAISNETVPLSNVYIKNISKNCDTTIYGEAPYLYIEWPSGIYEPIVEGPAPFIIEQNYPNPFSDNTIVNLTLTNKEFIQIYLVNILGKKLIDYATKLSKGSHTFEIRSLKRGIFFLTITNGENSSTIKLLSKNSGNQTSPELFYLGNSNIQPTYKQANQINNFVFQPGDQLLLKANANGYIENTIYDNPTENETYTFELQPENTAGLPTVTTTSISNITQESATSGGNVTDNGGATVTARGVCWSTNTNPTISDYFTTDGSGMGSFVSYLTGLSENTTYFVRAYATNSEGTGYGLQETFITLIQAGEPCPDLPTVIDIDGNEYNTVLVGNQCWMAENLKTTTYHNGTSIPNVTDPNNWEILNTGAYVWYDNDISWKEKYGALYNWHTVVDPNGLCPTGWHVPTHEEWLTLTSYFGGTSSPYGNEIKSCRQENSPLGGDCNTYNHPRWNQNNWQWGTDNYGFSGLPAGGRSQNGTFQEIGYNLTWWSSSEYNLSNAWFCFLSYDFGGVDINFYPTQYGFSVRCIKDIN